MNEESLIVICNNNPMHKIDLTKDPLIYVIDNAGPPQKDPLSILRYVFLCEDCRNDINRNGLQNWNINYDFTYGKRIFGSFYLIVNDPEEPDDSSHLT